MDFPLFTAKIEPIQMSYSFNFTLDKFNKVIVNKNSKEWFDILYNILPKFEINTKERVAGFLAQTSHESSDYNTVVENLNYSAMGLMKTWPKRFPTQKIATQYARNPTKIANKVYADRMGNGPESTGDGWKYRGRGIIQCTGKSNYSLASKELYNDNRLIDNPDLVLTDKTICIEVACWFWKRNNLNHIADTKDIVLMTKRINGGTVGLQDRTNRYNKALKVL
jgi:putative chitinase